ncbi:unnamed protein product [Lymnaea stagnalis]|uniref:Uncharacterized protein n=1 Tax=Lymnaea stagnalis TaxID=6523 RepID=A0AAV2HC01_LYMST
MFNRTWFTKLIFRSQCYVKAVVGSQLDIYKQKNDVKSCDIRMFLLSMSFVLLNFLAFTQGQTITLKYSAEESETSCTHGLIAGDTVVFKVDVDYSDDPQLKYVQIYINKKTSVFPNVKIYNIQEDCYINNTECKHTDASHVVITIKVDASKEYSGARIYVKVFTSESFEINSEYLHFPKIYDVSDVSSRLIFNGKEISAIKDDHLLIVNETDVNIVYICESQVSPCLIEISTNISTEVVYGYGYAVYHHIYSKIHDTIVITKYGACRLDRNVKTIRFNLKSDRKTSTEQTLSTDSNIKDVKSDWFPNYLLNPAFVTIVCSIITVGLLVWIYSRLKQQRR